MTPHPFKQGAGGGGGVTMGVTLVPLPENDENFLYFPYKSENPNTSISGVVLHGSF